MNSEKTILSKKIQTHVIQLSYQTQTIPLPQRGNKGKENKRESGKATKLEVVNIPSTSLKQTPMNTWL